MSGGVRGLVRLCAVLGAAVLPALPALAACEGVAPDQKLQNTFRQDIGRSLDRITEDGWIEIAVYEDFQPWSYLDDGKPAGVDVELARLIGEGLGVETRIRMVQAGETLDEDLRNYVYKGAIIGGRVSDIFLHAPYDVDYACRFDQVVFTGIYADEHLAIAYREDTYPDADDAPKPAYFRYDTVGVENDSISDFYLTGLVGAAAANIHRYPTVSAAMDGLKAGEVMAVMAPRAQLDAGLGAGIAVHEPPLVGLERAKWTLGIAVSTQHRPLAYAVDDIIGQAIADGRVQQIFADHGVTYNPALR